MAVAVIASGVASTAGEVRIEYPSRGRRAREAALLVLGGAIAALALLPVPLMHFFGIGLFLASVVVAVRRMRARAVIRSARGTCPKCGAAGPLFVGFGRRRFRLPVTTSCGPCAYPLTLDRPARSGPA